MARRGHSGTSLGGRIERSPKSARVYAARRRAEERAWQERNGPVVLYRVEDQEQAEGVGSEAPAEGGGSDPPLDALRFAGFIQRPVMRRQG